MKGYIGIDLGGTNIKAGVVDKDGKILCKHSVKTGAKRSMEDIVHDMGQLALDVIVQSGLKEEDIIAVGIGSPGTPNNQKGTLVYSSNLPFRDAPLREIIGKMTRKPVYIENDANCAAMAERLRCGERCGAFSHCDTWDRRGCRNYYSQKNILRVQSGRFGVRTFRHRR